MDSHEFNSQAQVDYIALGQKLSLGKEVTEWEKNLIFKSAIKYTSRLIDEKSGELQRLSLKSQDVRNHLDMIVLDRMVSLYQNGSTVMFENLKKTICDTFSIKEETLTDERLYTFLGSNLDKYFENEISPEVQNNMDFIRTTVNRLIPVKL